MDLLFQLRKARHQLRVAIDSYLIQSSGLFDREWYLKNNPDVAQTGVNPVWHYLNYGGFEGRDPGPNFDSRWYVHTYADVQKGGLNPLVHYLKYGKKNGCLPVPPTESEIEEAHLSLIRSSGFFDEALYLKNNPDVALAKVDPLVHYLRYGGFEGRDLPPHFYSKWYLDTYEDVRKSGLNPLVHYLKYGKQDGREATPPVFKLRRMYDYSKQTHSIVFEDSPEQIYLHRPVVIGSFSGELNAGEALCPRPYVSVIEDAVILGGRSLVMVKDKIVLSDEMVDFSTREFGLKASHVEIVHEGAVMFTDSKKIDLHIKEGILLSSGHDNNYFHWLVECLPKLLLIDSLQQFQDVPLLIPTGLHKNLMTALERLNINKHPLIYIEPDALCRVGRLIFPSALSQIVDRYEGSPVFNVDIVLSHKWLTKVSEYLKSSVDQNKKTWRKLFLTRRKGYRMLGNWEQLELLLLKHNFEIVDLEGASLDFQLELFSQAAVIVAPTGAALTNMLYCQPGTKVIIFMSNHEVTNFYFWSNLGAVNNLDVTTIAGERLFKVTNYYSVHDDYTIDVKLVLEEIKKYEQSISKKQMINRKSPDIIVEPIIPDGIKNATKIFVVGPPRSGTTLIYSMIANDAFLPECTFVSNLMKVFDETYKHSDKERFDYYGHTLANLAEIFKKPIYDFLYTAASKVGENSANRFIYKDPILTLYLQYFQLFFEDSYKVVFCVRDPRDVVTSMFKVLKDQNNGMDDNTLFDQAINTIFPFYQKIYDIDNTANYIKRNKVIFVKYEAMVTGNNETIQNLERFLRFPINSQGINENTKGKLDETSAFYSENYGKAITTSPVGKYRNSLDSKQIVKIENTFSYYIEKLNYG